MLNFAANAVLLRSSHKQEQNLMFVAKNALSQETLACIKQKIPGIVVEEVGFDAMHCSGGSIRCATQEIPCSAERVKSLLKSAADDSVTPVSLFKAKYRPQTNDQVDKIISASQAKL